MSGATVEEYIDLLNAEQHVDLQKLKDYARHGIQPEVRGVGILTLFYEVWLYLLGVLSDDKSQEMTSVRSKFLEYDSLDKDHPLLEKRIRVECKKYYQRRLTNRPRTTRNRLAAKSQRSSERNRSNPSTSDNYAELHRESMDSSNGEVMGDRAQEYGAIKSSNFNDPSVSDDEDLEEREDPEALAAQELKKFTISTENVVCAYLNRWSWNNSIEGRRNLQNEGSSESRSLNLSSESGQEFNSIDRTPIDQEQISTSVYGQLDNSVTPEFHFALIHLCAPFVKCVRVEAGMYFAFERLMTMLETHHQTYPLRDRLSTFLTLFRTTLPDLYGYFESESVSIISFSTSWLQHLLASEMRIEDLLRLWDTYFAVTDPLDLHLYVCISILINCQDVLEELDQSEIKSLLSNLPPLDVDRIINEAINIQRSHRQSLMEDE